MIMYRWTLKFRIARTTRLHAASGGGGAVSILRLSRPICLRKAENDFGFRSLPASFRDQAMQGTHE